MFGALWGSFHWGPIGALLEPILFGATWALFWARAAIPFGGAIGNYFNVAMDLLTYLDPCSALEEGNCNMILERLLTGWSACGIASPIQQKDNSTLNGDSSAGPE